jgi:exonuclease VII small subunit
MSETIQKKKQKKKDYDYEATAEKLNSMIEDLERTEKDTVLEIWKEYQKAPEAKAFFISENGDKRLIWGQTKCYEMFDKYSLKLRQPEKSEQIKESNAEKKVEQLVTLFDDNENPEFVEELQSEPAVKIVATDDFRIYESTMNLISRTYKITSSEFEVSHNYKMKLVEELKRAIKHLEDILKDVEGEYEST